MADNRELEAKIAALAGEWKKQAYLRMIV